MSVQVYQDSNFKIYKARNGFILHNKNMDFKSGHTHVQKFETCMVIIKLVERKQIPKSHSKHFLESILRVCNDKRYINTIKCLIQ